RAGSGRRGRESVSGGRVVPECDAGGVPGTLRPLEERLRSTSRRKRRNGAGGGISRLAPGPAPLTQRRDAVVVSRAGLRRGRDQAGAGELQAALPVSALDGRYAGPGRADAGGTQDSG